MRRAFRELLRSKYAALWSAGLAIIALVVPSALEGTDVRILFYLAYVLFTLAFFWTLAWWLTSQTLASQKPSRSKRKRAINSKRRRYVCYQIGGSLGILAVYVASLGLTASLK